MKLNCYHCGRQFKITAEQLGGEGVCPYCHKTVRLPDAGGMEDQGEEILEDDRVPWIRGSISGLVSLVLHTALLIGLALVTCDFRGGGGAEGEEVLIGKMPAESLSDNSAEDLDTSEAEVAVNETEETADSLEVVSPVEDAANSNRSMEDLADAVPSVFGGGSSSMSDLPGAGGAMGQGASFMGVQATGRRFCVIADKSGSMAGEKIEYVKEEVLETLSTMHLGARFQLIFFDNREKPYPKAGWQNPRAERDAVEDWMKTFGGSGGTEPTAAFKTAFALKPRPDVIFFMTDGLFPASTVEAVARMNRDGGNRRTRIHTISFMDLSAATLMEQIAKDSGGMYRHVSGY